MSARMSILSTVLIPLVLTSVDALAAERIVREWSINIDVAVTFASEISDPGVEVVGPLPRAISTPTGLVGFISAHSKDPVAARAVLRYLSSSEAAAVYKACAMQPGR